MLKRLPILLVVMFAALAFTGCNNAPAEEETKTDAAGGAAPAGGSEGAPLKGSDRPTD